MGAGPRQVLDRPRRRRRKRSDMIADPPRLRLEKSTGVLQQHIPLPEISAEGSQRKEPVEMALEDHPVERLDRSRD